MYPLPISVQMVPGDVVFANSTCFDDKLMSKLAQGASALKEGAIVITTTDPLPSPVFEVLEKASPVAPRVLYILVSLLSHLCVGACVGHRATWPMAA